MKIQLLDVTKYQNYLYKYMNKDLDIYKYKIAGELIRRHTRFHLKFDKNDKTITILPKKHLFNNDFVIGLVERSIKSHSVDYVKERCEFYYIIGYDGQHLILESYEPDYKIN